MKKQRRKSPSRIRYEARRPVFSFRLDKELNDRIQQVKKVEGKSNTDIIKAGVGLYEVKIRTEKEVWDKAYNQGFEEGIKWAEKEYAVPYSCGVCGKEIVVDSDAEKKAIREYMREHGWGHSGCVNRS